MTKLLEEAFKKASELPETEQDTLAKWLLEELESEREWDRTFAESQDVLGQLADEALDAHKKGKSKPMDFDRL
ncbi:MAG: hypothetical protein ABIF19_19965 [Planctomycetota bacterium]